MKLAIAVVCNYAELILSRQLKFTSVKISQCFGDEQPPLPSWSQVKMWTATAKEILFSLADRLRFALKDTRLKFENACRDRVKEALNLNYTSVELRPSDILYTQEKISAVFEDKNNNNTHNLVAPTIFESLHHAMKKKIKIEDDLCQTVVVVRREDRRTCLDSPHDPTVQPGWWAVSGLQQLWILKRLEDLRLIETVMVKRLTNMKNHDFKAICSKTVLQRGEEVEVEGYTPEIQAEIQAENHYQVIKKMETTINWTQVPTKNFTDKLRLSDYVGDSVESPTRSFLCRTHGSLLKATKTAKHCFVEKLLRSTAGSVEKDGNEKLMLIALLAVMCVTQLCFLSLVQF